MYDCGPEYNINLFVCIHFNKKCLSVVTVRLLNKLNKQTTKGEKNVEKTQLLKKAREMIFDFKIFMPF